MAGLRESLWCCFYISLKLYIEFDQKERRVISFEPEVVVKKDVGRFAANCTLKEHERRI